MKLSIKINYIHAEKMINNIPQQIQMQFQLNLPSSKMNILNNILTIPFVLTVGTTPLLASFTFKGEILVESNKEEIFRVKKNIEQKKTPQNILQFVLQYLMLETAILGRELGLPPIFPLPQGKSQPSNVMLR